MQLTAVKFYTSDGSEVVFLGGHRVPDDIIPGRWRESWSYEIRTPDGRTIESSAVNGPCDSPFPAGRAVKVWAGFMTAYADDYRYDMSTGQDGTDADGEPLREVHEWAYVNEDELAELADDTDDSDTEW